ncbi:hypothetical protein [Nocardioides sp. 503]|uniref:hypothetical protein n=1 Tax=Nocardioides sp. 503 TaxID=2508326 RepID=UPI00107026DC|nr:hypothetical protein [Nocardioides sp. 503]
MSRLVAAAALAAAMLVWPSSAPVQATGCSSGSGVSVVVDFAGLGGGGVQSACVGGSGGDARELFGAAGFALTDVATTPGFVCRVSGVPQRSCADTPPASSYWGLWWSDGRGGGWVYASEGVDSLTVPAGGYVAFAWDAVDGSPQPRFDPAKHAAAPSPSPAPSAGGAGNGGSGTGNGAGNGNGGQSSGNGSGSGGGQGGGATTGPSASGSAAPSASPSASSTAAPGKPGKPGKADKRRVPRTTPAPSGSPSATPTIPADDGELTGTAPTAAEPQDDGLPAFVAPVLIGGLFAVAGIVFLLRRRSGPA